MAVVTNGKVYVDGLYVGSVEESKVEVHDCDVKYEEQRVYIIKEVC